MCKRLILLSFLYFFTLQSFKSDPTFPFVGIETSTAARISEKLNINSNAVQLAISGYEKLKQSGRLLNQRYLTIVDFSKPSSEERLYIVDMEQQQMVLQTLVAHGKKSGTLFAKHFSNKSESNQSSLGFYITGNSYAGKHGKSMVLSGVEFGINDKVKQRAIVLHGANYVSNHTIYEIGYLGRSQGCPAVPQNQVANIIRIIQGESCLFIYAPDQQYLNLSQLI